MRKQHETDVSHINRRSANSQEPSASGQISSKARQKQHSRKLIFRQSQKDRLSSQRAENLASKLKFDRSAQERPATNLISETLAVTSASVSNAYGSDETETDNPGTESGRLISQNAESVIQQNLRHKHKRTHKQKLPDSRQTADPIRTARNTITINNRKDTIQYRHSSQSSRYSRWHQRRAIRKEYALARSRKAATRTKTSASYVRKAGLTITRSVQKLLRFILLHKNGVLIVLAIVLLLLLLFTVFASCSQLALAGFGAISMSSLFPADDFEITAADLEMTRYETLLMNEIHQIETTLPVYDRYDYALAAIRHDPFALAAYLATVYGSYTLDKVKVEIEQLFQELYRLTLTEKTEMIRTKDDESNSILIEIRVLETRLVRNNWMEVISARLTDVQLEQYAFNLEVLDSKRYFGSPFAFDWAPLIASHYGWRIHPIYKDMRIHRGLDIGVPAGTPIQSIHDGVVIVTRHGDTGFGNYIVIEDTDGYRSTYAHCQTILVQPGQTIARGEVIATAGSTGTSTGNHLHLEIRYQEQYLNPVFFIQKIHDTP